MKKTPRAHAMDRTLDGRRLRALIRANSATSLGRYFRGLARASIAAGAIAAASGCADSHWPGGGDEFEAPLCTPEGRFQPAHGLAPARTYDYLAAYSGGGMIPMASMLDEDGVRCETATDPVTCEAAVLESTMVFSNHLVLTEGDEVARFAAPAEVAGFLGPIDTAQEALVVVWNAGYSVTCGDLDRAAVREVVDGYEVVATKMTMDCDPVEVTRFLLHVARDAAITELDAEVLSSEDGVCVGRRPAGLEPLESGQDETGATGATSETARFFAEVARLEASAVHAFRSLARELEAHGAPEDLVRDALESAEDEVRHARAMGALAERFGATPADAVVSPTPVRSLFEIALDNATEGQVRETYGALVGTHQAMAARDAEVATAMRLVAEDETRHAALSWRIAEWIEPRLSETERTALRIARARAVLALRDEAHLAHADELEHAAGLPDTRRALALLDHLASTIWA
jgi:hypothetical protein